MSSETRGAWGAGLATIAGDTVLDAWFPDPRLGTGDVPELAPVELEQAARHDERRGVRTETVLVVVDDLSSPPATAPDAYLRLHLLSHRLVAPHGANLDGIFGVLANVAWTSHGPVDPATVSAVRLRFRRDGIPFSVHGVDKF